MKVGLIAMSGVRVRHPELQRIGVTLPQFVTRGHTIATLPSLGLLTVAGLTPDDVEVVYREMDALPADDAPLERFDLVGISSFTARIRAAYALADRYRARGVPVVLGGLHVSALPDEAQRHADSIVVFGAERAWPALIADFKQGRLRPRYIGADDRVFDAGVYAPPRFELLRGRPYNRITVQTSRGCPRRCEFCAASLRITRRFQQKPVALAVREIERALAVTRQPFFELADDNTFVNKKWGRDFTEAIAPLRIQWFTETDISVADDAILLERMARGGCRQVLIGLESPNADGLARMNPRDWKQRRQRTYREAIRKIQSFGVTVNGCFILGLDADTPDTFRQIRDFADASGLIEVQVTVQTPFPGTPLYDRLEREGRLLRAADWDRCTLFDVTFQPRALSVRELEDGLCRLFRELYNATQFARRKRLYMEIVKTLPGLES